MYHSYKKTETLECKTRCVHTRTMSIVNKSVVQDNNRERHSGVDNGAECCTQYKRLIVYAIA